MKILLTFGLLLVVATSSTRAQPVARKFSEFDNIYCDDEKARLDNFVNLLRGEPDAIGYIVFYGGRYMRSYGKFQRLPRRGEAEARAARLKPYITDGWPDFDSRRIIVINGGYRESWTAELWIVPKDAKPPDPTPTVDAKSIRFRRGMARKRDYRCYV